jgi:ubiquinone/menaquinone biosynthesis C-methylase UbiE
MLKMVRRVWRWRRHRAALALLSNALNSRVLDLGAGSGELLSMIPASCKVGIDLHPPASNSSQSFIVADAQHLPLRDSCFDIVTCLEVIEHVVDPLRVIEEISRVLKDGGTLLISTPDASLIWRMIWHIWTRTVAREWLGAHKHNFRLTSLLKLLQEGRFSAERVVRANFFILTIRAKSVKAGDPAFKVLNLIK